MLGLSIGLSIADAGGGGAVATTWNPADKGSQIVLSNGNLTATNNGAVFAWHSVRGTQSRTSGVKTYIVTCGLQGGVVKIGFANSTESMTNPIGDGVHSAGYASSGAVTYNGVTLATLAGYTTNDVITAEIDIGASTVRFKLNAGAFSAALSVAGIGATLFPAVSILDPWPLTAAFTGW